MGEAVRILGIDASYTGCGWAIVEDGILKDSGVISTSPEHPDVERQNEITEKLLKLITREDIDEVGIEGYSFASKGDALTRLAELGGVLRYRLRYEEQITPHTIPATTWRKTVLGKGNLAKDEVRLQAFKQYGVDVKDHNALEAWAVAKCLDMMKGGVN